MSEISNDIGNKRGRLGRGLGSLLSAQPNSSFGASAPAELPKKQDIGSSQAGRLTSLDSQNSQKKIDTSASSKETMVAQQSTTQQVAPVSIPPEARVWKIPIDKLASGKYQPRSNFEKEKLEELAVSIKANGIVQPIVARKLPTGKFEIIAGERRWRAAQLAGLHEVPVILKELQNQNALEIAIIENVQRENLNPIEEGQAYLRLSEEFGLTQQQIAEKVGKDRATVANLLRVLNLPKAVRDLVNSQQLSLGHAKVLLGLKDMTQAAGAAQKIISGSLSVRQAEKIVATLNQPQEGSGGIETLDTSSKLIAGIAEDLQKRLGTKVSIDYNQGKGRISVQFYSDEDFSHLVDRLKK